MTRRVVVAVLAVVLCGAVAWWLVGRREAPVVATADANANPGLDPVRRDAAIALARMPASAWTMPDLLPESLVASSAGTPKERCGVEERPVIGAAGRAEMVAREASTPIPGGAASETDDPAADPAADRPAGPHYAAAAQRLDAALRSSADPFARVVADWLDVDETLAPDERINALVGAAMATTDPRVYALAYRTCANANSNVNVNANATANGTSPAASSSCALLDARQWATLDAGNAAPWLYLYADATASGDVSAQQEALYRIASARKVEDRLYAPAAAVADAASQDSADLAATADLSGRALALAAGQGSPLLALIKGCDTKAVGDANRGQLCESAATVLFDHSDTLRTRRIGSVLYQQATGDASRREQVHAEQVLLQARWSPATGFSECQVMRDGLKRFQRSARIGEVAAALERARAFVPP